MKIKKYTFVTCSQEINESVVFSEYPDNLIVDLPTAQDMVAARLDFTDNRPHYIITDLSNVKKVTAEAKEYMQSPEGGLKNILGAAFLASNPVSALIANIFIKTPKEFEAKFFYSKATAIRWIEELQRKRL